MKNILIISFGQPTFDGRVQRLATCWQKLGFTVNIATPFWAPAGNPVKGLVRRISGNLSTINAVRQYNPHLLHIMDMEPLPLALYFAQKNKIPFIYDAHECFCDRFNNRPLLHKSTGILESTAISQSLFTTTVNQTIANLMTARYEQKIHVLPNYLLTEEKTTLSQENRLKQRKLLGFTENDRIFLYSGALFKGRGIDTLLNWCALFPTSWKLCIKGFGPLKNYLHQLANSSLKNRLVLLPPSPPKQLVHDIQFADVGVVPYVSSNRNRQVSLAGKFFEYTAAGLPVMATNIPEIERRIHEHQLGVSLNEFSVSTLTSGGVWLLNNYCQLQKNSLQYAADRNLDQKFKEILCSEKFFPISQVE